MHAREDMYRVYILHSETGRVAESADFSHLRARFSTFKPFLARTWVRRFILYYAGLLIHDQRTGDKVCRTSARMKFNISSTKYQRFNLSPTTISINHNHRQIDKMTWGNGKPSFIVLAKVIKILFPSSASSGSQGFNPKLIMNWVHPP